MRYSILVFGLSVDLEKGGTADKIIEGAKSAATQSAPNESHKVIREEKISVSGHPGKFLQVEVGSDIVQRSRIVVVGDHMYLLLVSSGRTAAPARASTRRASRPTAPPSTR